MGSVRMRSMRNVMRYLCRVGKATPMMGSKERHFAPLTNMSLEELVPHDHFYRHVEEMNILD